MVVWLSPCCNAVVVFIKILICRTYLLRCLPLTSSTPFDQNGILSEQSIKLLDGVFPLSTGSTTPGPLNVQSLLLSYQTISVVPYSVEFNRDFAGQRSMFIAYANFFHPANALKLSHPPDTVGSLEVPSTFLQLRRHNLSTVIVPRKPLLYVRTLSFDDLYSTPRRIDPWAYFDMITSTGPWKISYITVHSGIAILKTRQVL